MCHPSYRIFHVQDTWYALKLNSSEQRWWMLFWTHLIGLWEALEEGVIYGWFWWERVVNLTNQETEQNMCIYSCSFWNSLNQSEGRDLRAERRVKSWSLIFVLLVISVNIEFIIMKTSCLIPQSGCRHHYLMLNHYKHCVYCSQLVIFLIVCGLLVIPGLCSWILCVDIRSWVNLIQFARVQFSHYVAAFINWLFKTQNQFRIPPIGWAKLRD